MELERDVLVSPRVEVPVIEGELVTAIRTLAGRGVGKSDRPRGRRCGQYGAAVSAAADRVGRSGSTMEQEQPIVHGVPSRLLCDERRRGQRCDHLRLCVGHVALSADLREQPRRQHSRLVVFVTVDMIAEPHQIAGISRHREAIEIAEDCARRREVIVAERRLQPFQQNPSVSGNEHLRWLAGNRPASPP